MERLRGVERKDHVVGNVRLVRYWLKPLVDISADLRCEAAPEPSRGRVLVLEADFPMTRMSADSCLRRRPPDTRATVRSDDEELIESPRVTREAADESEADRSGWPMNHICDTVRVGNEVRLELASLERAVLVRMRVPEFRQVMQEELPETLDNLVLLNGQFAQLDHLSIVTSLGCAQSDAKCHQSFEGAAEDLSWHAATQRRLACAVVRIRRLKPRR